MLAGEVVMAVVVCGREENPFHGRESLRRLELVMIAIAKGGELTSSFLNRRYLDVFLALQSLSLESIRSYSTILRGMTSSTRESVQLAAELEGLKGSSVRRSMRAVEGYHVIESGVLRNAAIHPPETDMAADPHDLWNERKAAERGGEAQHDADPEQEGKDASSSTTTPAAMFYPSLSGSRRSAKHRRLSSRDGFEDFLHHDINDMNKLDEIPQSEISATEEKDDQLLTDRRDSPNGFDDDKRVLNISSTPLTTITRKSARMQENQFFAMDVLMTKGPCLYANTRERMIVEFSQNNKVKRCRVDGEISFSYVEGMSEMNFEEILMCLCFPANKSEIKQLSGIKEKVKILPTQTILMAERANGRGKKGEEIIFPLLLQVSSDDVSKHAVLVKYSVEKENFKSFPACLPMKLDAQLLQSTSPSASNMNGKGDTTTLAMMIKFSLNEEFDSSFSLADVIVIARLPAALKVTSTFPAARVSFDQRVVSWDLKRLHGNSRDPSENLLQVVWTSSQPHHQPASVELQFFGSGRSVSGVSLFSSNVLRRKQDENFFVEEEEQARLLPSYSFETLSYELRVPGGE
uniref:Muniscin C-terminal domain-containing protein n=1 Tax=Guillardia theta TaxID=55529 RepID=A0A7S4ULB4_GUITH